MVAVTVVGMVVAEFLETLRSGYSALPLGRWDCRMCQTDKDGIMLPCVALLVEGCEAATEDVPYATRSCSAQRTRGITLDFSSA